MVEITCKEIGGDTDEEVRIFSRANHRDIEASQGCYTRSSAVPWHGMRRAALRKRRAKVSDMAASIMSRFKELEAENAKLKKLCVDERLRSEIMLEAIAKKVVVPSGCCDTTSRAVPEKGVSIRLACQMFRIS